jgi:AraC-like DNA-binding protein
VHNDFADCALPSGRIVDNTYGDLTNRYLTSVSGTGMPPAPQLLRFSTELLPERDRFAAFREEFAWHVLNAAWDDLSGGRARIDLAFFNFGSVAGGTISGTRCRIIRSSNHVQNGAGDFMLHTVVAGELHTRHGGRDFSNELGSAAFLDTARPHSCEGVGGVRTVSVSRAALMSLVAYPEDLAGRVVRPSPALHLLNGYVRSLSNIDEAPSPELAEMVSTHLVDLVAAALGPTAEAKEIISQRGLRAARLRAILSQIAHHSSDPHFDLDKLARKLGLSRRYIQRLLEETGKSYTDHVVERRLDHCHAMLRNHQYLHMRIIDIAYAVGFSDISHFNRVFRRRFGDTPSGVRASASR